MREKPVPFHPVSEVFPLLTGPEFDELVADIRERGLMEPIIRHEGQILDGRNRYRACQGAGVPPAFVDYLGDKSQAAVIAFVVSTNLRRRHLTASQKAMVALDLLPLLEAEAKERQGTRTDIGEIVPQCQKGRSKEHAAKAVGVNPHYVSDAKKVATEAPDLASSVRAGERTLTEATRAVRERKREARRDDNRQKATATPKAESIVGKARFATIVLDPPWDVSDEGDVNQLGRAKADYATMPIAEVQALPVAELADDDCHLYLWITNRSLPKGFGLLEAWGFRHVTMLTWPKPSFGMGNYFRGQTEHVLFGVKGSQPLKRKDASTLLDAWARGKGGHSSKPVEFYPFVESCSPGPYLEMFARIQREGWTAWGADS